MTGGRTASASWRLLGPVALTAGAVAAAALLAPPSRAEEPWLLGWLLILGYTGHLAATAWLGSFDGVRAVIRDRPGRFAVVPVALVAAAVLLAVAMPRPVVPWLLLGFFAWQFWHFQKQNLGLAALAAAACGGSDLRPAERRVLLAAACCGIAGLWARPALLDLPVHLGAGWLFPAAEAATGFTLLAGAATVLRRPPAERPVAFVLPYLSALAFFVPVFAFRSPFAAVAGLVIAHGLQYLWLLAMVAGSSHYPRRSRRRHGAALLAVVVAGGIVLHAMSGFPAPGAWPARALYGAYLGIAMAHFTADGGLWRLDRRACRQFLTAALPYAFPAATYAHAGAPTGMAS